MSSLHIPVWHFSFLSQWRFFLWKVTNCLIPSAQGFEATNSLIPSAQSSEDVKTVARILAQHFYWYCSLYKIGTEKWSPSLYLPHKFSLCLEFHLLGLRLARCSIFRRQTLELTGITLFSIWLLASNAYGVEMQTEAQTRKKDMRQWDCY